jgi:transcriptional regulator
MYNPPAFKENNVASIHEMILASRLANLVTSTAQGMIASPIPMILDVEKGRHGVLHGHVARANPQWRTRPLGEALAIFMGPDAYVSPSWYATKRETGKVVPTWNYVAVHAYGQIEFFEDADRLLRVVTALTNRHEQGRAQSWSVSDAPADYIAAQLKGIVGIRLEITRLEGKRKLSQNRNAADRAGVIAGLRASDDQSDRAIADQVPA